MHILLSCTSSSRDHARENSSAFLPPPHSLTVPLHLCVVPVLTAQASAETKRVRAKESAEAYSPYAGSMSKSAGSGFGKYKAPRAFLKDEQAAVMKAYGLERLPGQ